MASTTASVPYPGDRYNDCVELLNSVVEKHSDCTLQLAVPLLNNAARKPFKELKVLASQGRIMDRLTTCIANVDSNHDDVVPGPSLGDVKVLIAFFGGVLDFDKTQLLPDDKIFLNQILQERDQGREHIALTLNGEQTTTAPQTEAPMGFLARQWEKAVRVFSKRHVLYDALAAVIYLIFDMATIALTNAGSYINGKGILAGFQNMPPSVLVFSLVGPLIKTLTSWPIVLLNYAMNSAAIEEVANSLRAIAAQLSGLLDTVSQVVEKLSSMEAKVGKLESAVESLGGKLTNARSMA